MIRYTNHLLGIYYAVGMVTSAIHSGAFMGGSVTRLALITMPHTQGALMKVTHCPGFHRICHLEAFIEISTIQFKKISTLEPFSEAPTLPVIDVSPILRMGVSITRDIRGSSNHRKVMHGRCNHPPLTPFPTRDLVSHTLSHESQP